MPIVSLREVSKWYGDVLALDRVSFEVEDGEFLVLLGPSGCGKTTTLRSIAGLEEPDEGDVSIAGRRVSSASARGPDAPSAFVPVEAREIGMVFQNLAIWPHMTVFQNVAFPLRLRGVAQAVVRQRVGATLALLGLDGLEKRPATQLSGGQQQRVALARALVFEPKLLLLDEPLSNLDAKLRVQMRVELKRLQRQTGITSVLVTHDQAESMSLADRIVVMNHGRIEQVGTPEEVYEHPATPFVSDFVGSMNMIASEVTATDDAGAGVVEIAMESGRTALRASAPGWADLRAADRVWAAVRPEKLTLSVLAPAGSPNVWRARVDTTLYYGDHREYHLAIAGQTLKARTPPETELARGSEIFISCAPEHVVLLRRSDWPP